MAYPKELGKELDNIVKQEISISNQPCNELSEEEIVILSDDSLNEVDLPDTDIQFLHEFKNTHNEFALMKKTGSDTKSDISWESNDVSQDLVSSNHEFFYSVFEEHAEETYTKVGFNKDQSTSDCTDVKVNIPAYSFSGLREIDCSDTLKFLELEVDADSDDSVQEIPQLSTPPDTTIDDIACMLLKVEPNGTLNEVKSSSSNNVQQTVELRDSSYTATSIPSNTIIENLEATDVQPSSNIQQLKNVTDSLQPGIKVQSHDAFCDHINISSLNNDVNEYGLSEVNIPGIQEIPSNQENSLVSYTTTITSNVKPLIENVYTSDSEAVMQLSHATWKLPEDQNTSTNIPTGLIEPSTSSMTNILIKQEDFMYTLVQDSQNPLGDDITSHFQAGKSPLLESCEISVIDSTETHNVIDSSEVTAQSAEFSNANFPEIKKETTDDAFINASTNSSYVRLPRGLRTFLGNAWTKPVCLSTSNDSLGIQNEKSNNHSQQPFTPSVEELTAFLAMKHDTDFPNITQYAEVVYDRFLKAQNDSICSVDFSEINLPLPKGPQHINVHHKKSGNLSDFSEWDDNESIKGKSDCLLPSNDVLRSIINTVNATVINSSPSFPALPGLKNDVSKITVCESWEDTFSEEQDNFQMDDEPKSLFATSSPHNSFHLDSCDTLTFFQKSVPLHEVFPLPNIINSNKDDVDLEKTLPVLWASSPINENDSLNCNFKKMDDQNTINTSPNHVKENVNDPSFEIECIIIDDNEETAENVDHVFMEPAKMFSKPSETEKPLETQSPNIDSKRQNPFKKPLVKKLIPAVTGEAYKRAMTNRESIIQEGSCNTFVHFKRPATENNDLNNKRIKYNETSNSDIKEGLEGTSKSGTRSGLRFHSRGTFLTQDTSTFSTTKRKLSYSDYKLRRSATPNVEELHANISLPNTVMNHLESTIHGEKVSATSKQTIVSSTSYRDPRLNTYIRQPRPNEANATSTKAIRPASINPMTGYTTTWRAPMSEFQWYPHNNTAARMHNVQNDFFVAQPRGYTMPFYTFSAPYPIYNIVPRPYDPRL